MVLAMSAAPNTSGRGSRTLVLVDRAEDAGPPDPAIDVVVLDTTWSPAPDGRSDVASIRDALQTVIRTVDLFEATLERLDAWATASDLAGDLTIGGVTWWNHVRMAIRWDVHELVLWRHVLDILAPAGRYDAVTIPAHRTT